MSQETDRGSGGGGEGHALLESLISEGKGKKDQVTKQEASFKKAASVRKMSSSLTEQEVTCVTLPVDPAAQGRHFGREVIARRGSRAGRNRAGTVGERMQF